MKKSVAASLLLILVLMLPFLFISSCKKENANTQWEVDVLAPILHASLSIENLIPDSLRSVSEDSAVTLVYEGDVFSTPLDSIFQIPDTTTRTPVVAPLALPLRPGFIFYNNPSTTTLAVNGVELRYGIIKSGFAQLVAKNYLQTKVIYTYTIPKAKLNGVALSITQEIAAAPPGAVTSFTGMYDLSGYDIDLTGLLGTQVNTITYTVTGMTDPAGHDTMFVSAGDTIADITTGFIKIIPSYAKGYIGQSEIDEGPFTQYIAMGRAIQSGSISLDDVVLKMHIVNNIGADAQAIVTSLQSLNSKTGTTVALNSSALIGRTININRAVETGAAPSPVIASDFVVQIDKTNSNILSFIENLPDSFRYNMHFNINPLGNVSGSNDFLYTDKLITAKLNVEVPLKFGVDHIALADTQAISISDSASVNAFGDGTFTLIADNGFPYQFDMQLYILDENNNAADSLFVPNSIAPAPIDINNKVTGDKQTRISIPVTASRKQKLLASKKLAIRASVTSTNSPAHLQIYSGYHLNLKLVADVQYLIH